MCGSCKDLHEELTPELDLVYARFDAGELNKKSLRTELTRLLGPEQLKEALARYTMAQLLAENSDPTLARRALLQRASQAGPSNAAAPD